jgi:hypothetical protein
MANINSEQDHGVWGTYLEHPSHVLLWNSRHFVCILVAADLSRKDVSPHVADALRNNFENMVLSMPKEMVMEHRTINDGESTDIMSK